MISKSHPKSVIRRFRGSDSWVSENLQEESKAFVILQVEPIDDGKLLLVEYVDKVDYVECH